MRLGLVRTAFIGVFAGAAGACAAQTLLPAGPLLLPSGVAYDSAGNLFVADARRHQVLELTLSGVTSVIAGTGAQGFAGDGGPAAQALLNAPQSVAVASDGTVYIADTGNQRVRAVAGGSIRTVAGSGAKGFGGDGGDALSARLSVPVALATDATGAVLIADSGNHRVRRLAGGLITTFAGTGVQGFGGDGGPALLALLDTPAGVAVSPDGRVFVADSHNQRIRVIATDGKMATMAGSDVRGFGGDGGAAVSAALDLPRGVAITAAGEVVFADSDNQRLRLVDAQGVIRTIAGSGVQGAAVEGVAAALASLDSPRSVTISGASATVFADGRNRLVRAMAADSALYAVLAPAPRPVSLIVVTPPSLTYGQGSVAVRVAAAAPAVQGRVDLLDAGLTVSSAPIVAAAATLAADTLSAGTHTLAIRFGGDGLHPATVSAALPVAVAPAPVVATAAAATIAYGSFSSALTGTATGVLARDAANAVVSFASSAPDLSPVGTYSIAASLAGSASGNYLLRVGAGSGSLTIVPAPVSVAVSASHGGYAGLPLTLKAQVNSSTRGAPTGTVIFYDGGVPIGSGTLTSGVASTVLLAPAAGVHAFLAAYGGDGNFLAGSSPASAIAVGALPDFALSVTTGASQTVVGGTTATVGLSVAGQGAFSGSVTMSVAGLPPGATTTFSPTAVVPGNGAAAVTLTIQTIALAALQTQESVRWAGLFAIVLIVACGKRRRLRLPSAMALLLLAVAGCGDRSFSAATHAAPQTFPITITATSTNLVGAVVTRSAGVTLIVQ